MLHSNPRATWTAGLRRARGWLAATSIAIAAAVGGSALATADTSPAPVPADNSAAPFAVENFDYPGVADNPRITLLRGDGHVTLADCATPTSIQIWTRATTNNDGRVCFAVNGTTGYLAVEMPEVFAVQTAGRAVHASLTADGVTQTLDVPKDGFKGIGEGTGAKPTTLVELRITG
ncbi:hypothetical protein [Kitasatospora sp. NPDC057223]|uniref:hypothetical protein n=1 Tax=Kitasatospora sp. NPDC057223 TaxID=3346055 RepID=UPI00362FF2AC